MVWVRTCLDHPLLAPCEANKYEHDLKVPTMNTLQIMIVSPGYLKDKKQRVLSQLQGQGDMGVTERPRNPDKGRCLTKGCS